MSFNDTPVVNVVTPCVNAERFIGQTIASVVGQAGEFFIRYHLQDGGSTDDTMAIATRWQDLITCASFPIMCLGVSFSIESAPDRGTCDAIATGFRQLTPRCEDLDLMTWINADDVLAPGAMRAAVDAFRDIPGTDWIGGRRAAMDESGTISAIEPALAYARENIAAGLHDGRVLPFVMQEGTFWRPRLWRRVGGIDRRFRLAGDWDLWRRFSEYSEFTTLDTLTGLHRRRPGQLTSDLAAYYDEVDRCLARVHDGSTTPLLQLHETRSPQITPAVARRTPSGWKLGSGAPCAPVFQRLQGSYWTKAPGDGFWFTVSGFRGWEGPHPDLGVPYRFNWTVGGDAVLNIFNGERGRRRIDIALSSMIPGQTLEIAVTDQPREHKTLAGAFPRLETVSLIATLSRGWCMVRLGVDQGVESDRGERLGVLVQGVELRPERTPA